MFFYQLALLPWQLSRGIGDFLNTFTRVDSLITQRSHYRDACLQDYQRDSSDNGF